jgi:hypothetical protein
LFSYYFCTQVPFPIQDIYLRMPADDNDVPQFSSSQLPNSQEESTIQASSPDVSTPKKKDFPTYLTVHHGEANASQLLRTVHHEEANV